jgi:hypothetical protein
MKDYRNKNENKVENKAGEQCWYWGIFTAEGDEWGNYSDLVAEKYCVIEPLN